MAAAAFVPRAAIVAEEAPMQEAVEFEDVKSVCAAELVGAGAAARNVAKREEEQAEPSPLRALVLVSEGLLLENLPSP